MIKKLKNLRGPHPSFTTIGGVSFHSCKKAKQSAAVSPGPCGFPHSKGTQP